MKNIVKALIIDDNDLDEECAAITKILQSQGRTLQQNFIDVSDQKYRRSITPGGDVRLDQGLIIKDIEEQGLMDMDFDIIACDFNLSDDYVNGYDLLSKLLSKARNEKSRLRKARILFFTGQVKKLKEVVVDDIKGFIKLNVYSIIDRPHLVLNFVRLSNSIGQEMSLESMFLEHLEPHKDKIFKNTYPQFYGKNIFYIMDEIEKESHHGRQFLNTLVELTVAHMINLQVE